MNRMQDGHAFMKQRRTTLSHQAKKRLDIGLQWSVCRPRVTCIQLQLHVYVYCHLPVC